MIKSVDYYFGHTFMFIKFAGMWKPERTGSFLKYFMWWLYNVYFTCFATIIVSLHIGALFETYNNKKNFIKNLNMALQLFVGLLKLIFWHWNKNDALQVIQMLSEKSSAYKTFKLFDPDEILRKEAKLKKINDYNYLIAGYSVVIFGSINSLVKVCLNEHHYIYFDSNNQSHIKYTEPLPYFSITPWDYTSSFFLYTAAVLLQAIGNCHFSFIIVGIDVTCTAMLLYSVAHLKVLTKAIATIRERSYKKLNIKYIPDLPDFNPRVHEAMDEEMNLCITHLQAIFRMCTTGEEICKFFLLMQTMLTLALLCTSLYLLSEVPIVSGTFFIELNYFLGVIWQIFQYCWYGDKLTLSSLAVSDAFYETDWVHASKSFKYKMLFSMCRLRKPIIFTAGKMMYLKLSTFVSILRVSYSFYTLLKTSSGIPLRQM